MKTSTLVLSVVTGLAAVTLAVAPAAAVGPSDSGSGFCAQRNAHTTRAEVTEHHRRAQLASSAGSCD